MCGIAGIISRDTSLIQQRILSDMANSMAHRGPDGQACWINQNNNCGFAHRRLIVIDTSDAAAQPMHYINRYSIVYNGEIYNYPELKETLLKKGYIFRTSSDTEVILASYAEYGHECVNHFDGMFAFAIWDDKQQELFCARDRFGEKPFYYYYNENNGSFYFASELKGIFAAGVERVDNYQLLLGYIALGQTSNPVDPTMTFDARIRSLPAAYTLRFSYSVSGPVINRYWNISSQRSTLTFKDALEKFNELFTRSVERRLRSDVSLGTSLSGGLDSSSIAATVSALKRTGLKTFTARFPGFDKDESDMALKVSRQFSFNNFSIAPDADGFIKDLDRLIKHQEEPFTSSSVYAQYKVFELAAKEGVTVLLDGQGADETLAGYDKYLNWRVRAMFPKVTAALLRNRDKLKVYNNRFIDKNFLRAYREGLKIDKPQVKQLNDMLYFDCFRGGLAELLRYADRNSMAHGREVRLPFLNHDLIAFVFSLPASFKIGHGYTKWILREAMKGRLSDEIILNKRKTGFEPPQRKWMENSRVVEYAFEARKMLLSEKILNSKILEIKPASHAAYDKDSSEWRWLIAGSMMRINKKGSE